MNIEFNSIQKLILSHYCGTFKAGLTVNANEKLDVCPTDDVSSPTFRLSGCQQPLHPHQDLLSVRSNRVVRPCLTGHFQLGFHLYCYPPCLGRISNSERARKKQTSNSKKKLACPKIKGTSLARVQANARLTPGNELT